MLLGINIDHIATVRNARGTVYPSPVEAALVAETAGADLITMHLREDRRHIKDADVFAVRQAISTRLNLEMALTEEMLDNALQVKPQDVCIVPEKRQEITTEGGLAVLGQEKTIATFIEMLEKENIRVSLFIDPDIAQIQAAKDIGASVIELHTGRYADAADEKTRQAELQRIKTAAEFADKNGFCVNAGHGLNIHNVADIARLPEIRELNIGHAIIAQALFLGLATSVKQMKTAIFQAQALAISNEQ